MSKHTIEINFDELRFNLYDLLNVSSDASEKRIKKQYRKLIMKFHPDKNNEIDEEIYNHLTIANQVLTNDELRAKYDGWLKSFGEESLDHDNLKQNYEKQSVELKNNFPSMPSEAKILYHEKVEKLNMKHGLNQDWNKESTMLKYEKKKEELKKILNVTGEKIKNKKEFNNKFDEFLTENKNQQIIKSVNNQQIMEYNGDLVGDEYLSVTNYNLLYSDDNVQTDNYSSLDRAFMLQPKIEFEEKDVSEKMKEYKNLSQDLSKLYPKKDSNHDI